MTPHEIAVLLHCHTSPTPLPTLESNATRDAVSCFLEAGLIEPESHGFGQPIYRTTEGGKMLMSALCAVPFPVKQWVMPGQPGGPRPTLPSAGLVA